MSALGFGTLANKNKSFYGSGGGGGGGGPSSAPTVPVVSGTPTTTSITVTFDIAGITGTPPILYGIYYGTTTTPITPAQAFLSTGTTYIATVSNLAPGTTYYFKSLATDSEGVKVSAVSTAISTGTAVPVAPSPAPSIPDTAQIIIPSTSITVFTNRAGVTGTAPIVYQGLYGTTTTPSIPFNFTNAFGSLYVATISGLIPNTTYYFVAIANNGVAPEAISAVSPGFVTSGTPGAPPSSAPTVPIVSTPAPSTTSITVSFDVTGITGTPPPGYSASYSTSPTGVFIPITATQSAPSSSIYIATANNLTPGTTYYFQSVASNGTQLNSASSAGISTTALPPLPSLKTNVVTPFLIQGPRFGTTAPWPALDYYISGNATGAVYPVGGSAATGQQVYGNMYAGTVGTPGDISNGGVPPVPYAGACSADQVFNTNFGATSDAYLDGIQTALGSNGRVLASWGGYFADVRGLFGPYAPTGYPGTQPTAQQVVQSFLFNYCGITTGNTNPLNWVRTNSNNTSSYTFYYDGLVMDFENVGNGNPLNSFPYAPPGSPPAFPASATDPAYAPYINAIGDIPSQFYAISPTLFLGNAPVSFSLIADIGTTNICAPNSALNTWYGFATATIPPTRLGGANPYNGTVSNALNDPRQLSYMDDVFVQFYNESADYYPGGQYFANLLACWGFVALEAQKYGRKKTTINLGLARGNIIPGGGPPYVADAQGPTPPLPGIPGPPYTLWYPQYCTPSPPNAITSNPSGLDWPNTGPSVDPKNVSDAIKAANTILKSCFSNDNLVPSDWLSGMGFWAAENATLMAKAVYNNTNPFSPTFVGGNDVLPHTQVYCWGDASYPAPDPKWPGNVPIICNWE